LLIRQLKNVWKLVSSISRKTTAPFSQLDRGGEGAGGLHTLERGGLTPLIFPNTHINMIIYG
jgi:hypothetical protein